MKRSMVNNKLENVKKYFLYILPTILFFSYYPLIKIGESSKLNLELSLPIIWLFCFSLISIPSVIRFLKYTYKKYKIEIIISLLLPTYSLLSIIWSTNYLRAILTTGVVWCVWLSIISLILFFKKHNGKEIKRKLLKYLFVSTFIICVFCWIQCILDIFGMPREETLLCAGCTSYVFGFPHPSGFAIEPQFMGNLLLVPCFVSLFTYCKNKEIKRKKTLLFFTMFILSTLFLTMSRGAIYSFCVGIIYLILREIIKNKNKKILLLIPIVMSSFVITICFQGVFAEFSKTNDNFISGISKVLNQMSLGIIDIPYQLDDQDTYTDNKNGTQMIESQFDGYAEISTTTRLDFSMLAITAWLKNPSRFIFGVGVGSAGEAMNEINPGQSAEKEIVQNEIVEIALELGLVGILILILNILLIIKIIRQHSQKNILFAILLSLAVSYMFFSGIPNAIHMFLLPVITFFILNQSDINCLISLKSH